MSAVTTTPRTRKDSRLQFALLDWKTITKRNLLTYVRKPDLLVFSTIQPVMFVLLFVYVWGGAMQKNLPAGVSYIDFLMPGIFVQTVTFGATGTAIGLAADLKSGLIERFRSLPMARSAVLFGRTGADLARNIFVAVLMAAVGFLVQFRIHGTWYAFVGAMMLVLAFGYVFSWVMATIGLIARDPESAQAAAFPLMAPLVFASSAFVPITSMPGWLQAWAKFQPVSVTANAARNLVLGRPAGEDVLKTLLWCVVLLVVFVPLAVRRYRKAA